MAPLLTFFSLYTNNNLSNQKLYKNIVNIFVSIDLFEKQTQSLGPRMHRNDQSIDTVFHVSLIILI